jgi:hypothetical protein
MAGPPKGVKEAWVAAFDGVFFNIMVGMTQAETIEEDFAKLRVEVQVKTKEELKKIAVYAGEYYAEHANPSPGELSETESNKLTIKALEYALRRFADGKEK